MTGGMLNNGVLDQSEQQVAERVHAVLCRIPRVFLIRPDDERHVTLELHTKRGRQQVYTGITVETALELIDDVTGTGHFGIALHAAAPLVFVKKLEVLEALATAHPVGGVQ